MNNIISIIVPVFNEEATVREVVSGIRSRYPDAEVIVVNDGSTDSSLSQLSGLNLVVLSHRKNLGYGASLKAGIRRASGDLIITIDADGEHAPEDIEYLVKFIGSFDMVVGMRKCVQEPKAYKRIGKFFLRKTANFAAGQVIPDINSGFRVFRKSDISVYLGLFSDAFSFHTTSTLVYLFKNKRIKYVPVRYHKRVGSSKVTLFSGMHSFKSVLKVIYLFRPDRLFALFGILVTAVIIPLCVCLFLNFGRKACFIYILIAAFSLGAMIIVFKNSFGFSGNQGAVISDE